MIDLEFVERLIQALDESSLDTLELERGGTKIRLSKSPSVTVGAASNPAPGQALSFPQAQHHVIQGPGDQAAAPPAEGATAEGKDDHLIKVISPMVGTFYRAPSPESPPYVEVGNRIGKGSVLCIIEAMKLMNELESEVEGTIVKVLVENAEPVEFGQVLFLVDPS